MNLTEIISALENLTQSDRALDVEIAQLFNYKGPKSPYFTRSIDAAMRLATAVCINGKIGISWEDGMASAKVGDGPYCQSTTAPLALCLATLKSLQARQ